MASKENILTGAFGCARCSHVHIESIQKKSGGGVIHESESEPISGIYTNCDYPQRVFLITLLQKREGCAWRRFSGLGLTI